MEIKIEQISSTIILRLIGKLDSNTAGMLQSEAMRLIEEGNAKFIIACKDLSYISSAGLRVFYLILKSLDEVDGKIVLSEPDENVKQVFDIVELSSDIKILNSIDEAMDFLKED